MTSQKPSRRKKVGFTPKDGLLFANHPIPMWVYDLETLAFLEVNGAAVEKYGYTRDEFLALTIKDIRPLEDTERLTHDFEKERPPLQHSGEWRHRLKNGQVIEVELTSHTLDFEGHKATLVMAKDITERKRAEEQLLANEERFRMLFDKAPLGYQSLDVDGKFIDINQTWLDMLGYKRDEVLGRWFGDFLTPDFVEGFRKRFPIFKAAGQIHSEFEMLHKNGNRLFIAFEGQIGHEMNGDFKQTHCILQDITKRKQAEENLIVSEVRYRRLFEAARDGILILDAETGVVIDVNPFLSEMLGFSHEEICGKELWEMGFFKDIAENKANFLELQEKGYIRYDDLPLEVANGRKFYVEFISNIYNVNHHKVIQCNIRDITERKQAEEKLAQYSEHLEEMVQERTSELRETQEKLVRNEKLAVLGQLAGGVGHELRNPLAVINNAIYYLKLIGADSSEKVKEYLGIIQTEAHTAEKIITDLLDFARIKSVDLEPVSASKLVARVLERYPAPQTVKITLEIPEDLPKLYVDPRQMEQVLGNLVLNACQAMSAGDELTITAYQKQEMIAIAVKDTGVGISSENMKKLFEPLFTTKAKGIGLGLAVSQKLAEANGGRIEVQSEIGKGSTFTVWLPVHRVTPEQ